MPDMGGHRGGARDLQDRSRGQDPDVQRHGPAGAGGRGDPGGRQGFRGEAVPALPRARGGAARPGLTDGRLEVRRAVPRREPRAPEQPATSCCSSGSVSPAPASRWAGCSARSTRSRAWPRRWASPAWPSWPTALESLLDALRHGRVHGRRRARSSCCSARSMRWARRSRRRRPGRRRHADAVLGAALERPAMSDAARRAGRAGHAGVRPSASGAGRPTHRAPARCRSTIRPDAVMRGARAVLAVRRAEALGRGHRGPPAADASSSARSSTAGSRSGSSRRPARTSWPPRSGPPARSSGAVRGAAPPPRATAVARHARSAWTSRRLDRADEAGGRAGGREEPAGRHGGGSDDPALPS